MRRITYTLLNRNMEKIKTVMVYKIDPVYLAIETYLKTETIFPILIEELNILIEKIEDSDA